MKKFFAVAVIIISLTACNDADKTETMTTETTTMPEQKIDPEPMATMPAMENGDVMMKDGKMMMMKDGAIMEMDKDMTMSNGTKVMKNGEVKMKDGKMVKMSDGSMMKMNGDMMGADGKMMMMEEPKM